MITDVERPLESRSPLLEEGICHFRDPYSPNEIGALNAAFDPIFREREVEKRSYIHIDEIVSLGLFETILNSKMRGILLSIMPDPVLYHFLVIETQGNDRRPNLFGDTIDGWHRDRDCSFTSREPTHVSVFIYLTDVGETDGAFEFVPQNPNRSLHSLTPIINVKGPQGYTFGWQRSFYHRASPNRGPRRRRLIKISVQRNRFPSVHLQSERFRRVVEGRPAGDALLDVLLGRYQGGVAPNIRVEADCSATAIPPSGRLSIPSDRLIRAQIRTKVSMLRQSIEQRVGLKSAPAYE